MNRNGICKANAVVNNWETCKDAVSEIKKLIPNAYFKWTEVRAHWPKGCYLLASSDVSDNKVYFNEHHAGSNHKNARPICLGRGIK